MVKNRSSNPNGTLWANKKDKLGAKLLAKWGWAEGKGLGKNEDGMTEHVKVTKKDDNTGVGTSMNVSSWTGNTTRFDDTLARLAGSPSKKKSRKKRATSACSSESSAAPPRDVYIPRSPKVGATNLMSTRRIYNRKRIAAKSEIKSNEEGRKIIVGKRPDDKPVHPKEKKPEKVEHIADQLTEIQHFAAESMTDYFAKKAAAAGEEVETVPKTTITSFAAFNAGLSSGKAFDMPKEVSHAEHKVERKQKRQARRERERTAELNAPHDEPLLVVKEKAKKEKKEKKAKKEKKEKKSSKDKKEKKEKKSKRSQPPADAAGTKRPKNE